MSISTRKFSEFIAANLNNTNQTVGLSGGANAIFDGVITWTTATRPVSPTAFILGCNTDTGLYEYYDPLIPGWAQILSTALGPYLPLAGGTMAGVINMNSHEITGLPAPVANSDGTNKLYVDTSIATALGAYLPLAGGTMSGAISMGSHFITNLLNPVNPQDAATKLYVDNSFASGITPAQIQHMVYQVGIDSGVADAYVLTFSPPITSLTDGMILSFTPTHANLTNAPTVNAGTGVKGIYNIGGQYLLPGDIDLNVPCNIQYDAFLDNFFVLNPQYSLSVPIVSQTNDFTWASDTGVANAYIGTYNPPNPPNINGLELTFYTTNANSGASTFDCGSGALPILNLQYSPLIGGEIISGNYKVALDQSLNSWILQNSSLITSGGGSSGLTALSFLLMGG